MKKLMFVAFFFVSIALLADETNWIQQNGWVTGPGSEDNKDTQLLPFKLGPYLDNHPILYETDMGWPVPDVEDSDLKYLFFGDTKFFMRDSNNNNKILGKITDGSETLLDFGVENNSAEIEKQPDSLPPGGQYLSTVSDNVCTKNCVKEHGSCNRKICEDVCKDDIVYKTNYSDCFSYCNTCNSLEDEFDIFDFLDINLGEGTGKADICQNFCMFDMVDTYAFRRYFDYDWDNFPTDIYGRTYNNGTSNIFLAAELNKTETGNTSQYDINFINAQPPEGSELNSPQIHSNTDKRRSKSIWVNAYERGLVGFIGIYPRGYFYACPGNPGDPCPPESKKLFVPYNVGNWYFLQKEYFCGNWSNNQNNNDAETELKRQEEELGIGIYDFAEECRIRFSNGVDSSFSSCVTPVLPNGEECFRENSEENYSNKHILWPHFSKMSNITVIHDISKDLLSADDKNIRKDISISWEQEKLKPI